MAKAGYPLGMEVYKRRDPVMGDVKSFVRSDHSRQSSANLKAFQRCVRQGLEGYKASGNTPKERAQNQRQHFAQVAQSCRGSRAR